VFDSVYMTRQHDKRKIEADRQPALFFTTRTVFRCRGRPWRVFDWEIPM